MGVGVGAGMGRRSSKIVGREMVHSLQLIRGCESTNLEGWEELMREIRA